MTDPLCTQAVANQSGVPKTSFISLSDGFSQEGDDQLKKEEAQKLKFDARPSLDKFSGFCAADVHLELRCQVEGP